MITVPLEEYIPHRILALLVLAVRRLNVKEIQDACKLMWKVLLQFEAPEYSQGANRCTPIAVIDIFPVKIN